MISGTERSSKRANMDICSEIIGISRVADTVHPPGDGLRGGQPSWGAVESGSLPWAVHRVPLSFPSSQPASVCTCGREHIDPRPDFGGGATMKMLMGPEMIVDVSCLGQRPIERRGIVKRMLSQQPLHRADGGIQRGQESFLAGVRQAITPAPVSPLCNCG